MPGLPPDRVIQRNRRGSSVLTEAAASHLRTQGARVVDVADCAARSQRKSRRLDPTHLAKLHLAHRQGRDAVRGGPGHGVGP